MAGSLEVNKVVAAVLTAGVVAMAAGFAAEVLFPHEEHDETVYRIAAATEEAAGEAAAPAEPSLEPVAPLMAAADPVAGEGVAKKCTSCHSFDKDGGHKIGPNLWGILGRQIAGAAGYSYSDALQGLSGQSWNYENLNAFIAKPKDFAPGTKMGFAGLKSVDDRAALIAYLRQQSDAPATLPEATAMETVAEEAMDTAGAAMEQAAEAVDQALQATEEAAGEAVDQAMQAAEEATGEMAAVEGGLGTAIAPASAEAGEKVARKCKSCHDLSKDGKNKIGPALYDIVGRGIAEKEGYKFSSALSEKSDMAWSYENLDAFLADPKGWAPGTKMNFAGIKDEADRAALIAYLRSQSDNPPPLP